MPCGSGYSPSGTPGTIGIDIESCGRRRKLADTPPVVGKDHPDYYRMTERYRLTWEVSYEAGEIKVIAYRNGHPIGEDFRKTAYGAAAVKLTAERPDLAEDELGFIRVEVTDDDGTPVPMANDRISFRLEGPGEIVAVGNGSPDGLDSFAATASHPLYYGRALVIVRRTGKSGLPLKLTASAPKLRPAVVTLDKRDAL